MKLAREAVASVFVLEQYCMMSPVQDAPNGISKTTTNAPSNRRIIGEGGP